MSGDRRHVGEQYIGTGTSNLLEVTHSGGVLPMPSSPMLHYILKVRHLAPDQLQLHVLLYKIFLVRLQHIFLCFPAELLQSLNTIV